MKVRSLLLALLLSFATILPSISATGGDPTALDTTRPRDNSGTQNDPNNFVDRIEPRNNNCDGAEEWPMLTTASSNGFTGGSDPADWSIVELYRTESVTAEVTKGTALVAYAEDCGSTPTLTEHLNVGANGWYPLYVAPTIGTTSYTVKYVINANDAGLGRDAVVEYVNAMPQSDPTERPKIAGSLPYRRDLGQDVDWYQVGTSLAQTPGLDGDLALGLLTVTFDADCYTATPGFTLYQSDMTTKITPDTIWACGQTMASCVAASFSNVYAKLEADRQPDRGAGYNFFAEISPLSIVDLDTGEFTYINPEHPWCDPLTPALLGLMGDSMGVVDKEGRVVAKVTSPSS